MKRQFFFRFALSPFSVCVTFFWLVARNNRFASLQLNSPSPMAVKRAMPCFQGSVIYVHDRGTQVMAQAINGTENELELMVKRYAVSTDTVKKESTIREAGTDTKSYPFRRMKSLILKAQSRFS
jgi:hypothetical protein